MNFKPVISLSNGACVVIAFATVAGGLLILNRSGHPLFKAAAAKAEQKQPQQKQQQQRQVIRIKGKVAGVEIAAGGNGVAAAPVTIPDGSETPFHDGQLGLSPTTAARLIQVARQAEREMAAHSEAKRRADREKAARAKAEADRAAHEKAEAARIAAEMKRLESRLAQLKKGAR